MELLDPGDQASGAHDVVGREQNPSLMESVPVSILRELIVRSPADDLCAQVRDRRVIQNTSERVRRQHVNIREQNLLGRHHVGAMPNSHLAGGIAIHVRNDQSRAGFSEQSSQTAPDATDPLNRDANAGEILSAEPVSDRGLNPFEDPEGGVGGARNRYLVCPDDPARLASEDAEILGGDANVGADMYAPPNDSMRRPAASRRASDFAC